MITQISDSYVRIVLSVGGFCFFLLMELACPYRQSTVSKTRRILNNITLTLCNSIVISLLFASSVSNTTRYVTTEQAGLIHLLPSAIPSWGKTILIILFLDFMIYIWHLLNHEIPLLFRFHQVHHSDMNMDVSTATRFHPGELILSALLKLTLIYLIGADVRSVVIFESLVVLCAQFHHSSLNLPSWFEKLWWTLFVPPSMHRIHHSVLIRERNSNYGVIFSFWDRMLGTLITNTDQHTLKIGMGKFPHIEKLDLHYLLLMPFSPSKRSRQDSFFSNKRQ